MGTGDSALSENLAHVHGLEALIAVQPAGQSLFAMASDQTTLFG
jgi:hypothetical protein